MGIGRLLRSLSHAVTLLSAAALVTAAFAPFVSIPVRAEKEGSEFILPGQAKAKLGKEKVSLGASRATTEDPFTSHLSGPGWVQSLGLDTRFAEPGGTEMDRGSGGPSWSAKMSASSAPAMQVGGVSVPFRNPAPSFSRNMLITRDYSNTPVQLEPHMAVDPKDQDHIVVGVIDYSFPSVSVYVTFDGGETWQGPIQTRYMREDLIAGGDPVLAFDRQGNVYIIYISIGNEEFLVGQFSTEVATSTIAITKSKDGGLTWSDPVATAKRLPFTNLEKPDADRRARGEINIPFLDKPWLTIGPDPKAPAKDVIHISYTEFVDVQRVLYVDELPVFAAVRMQTTIKAVHSNDLGQTWSDAVSVSPTVRRESGREGGLGNAVQEGQRRVLQGSEPHAAPDGTVYVSWMDSTDDDSQKGLAEIYVARSDDAGKTYGKPVRATVFNEPGFRPRTSFFRYWSTAFPRGAVGPNGEVYLVYGGLNSARPEDDGDVYFMRSTDKGVTWSRPKRLSGDESPSLQFFPAVAVDPTGNLHVMWADTRDDPRQTSYNIYYSTSANKGDTWGFDDAKQNLHLDDTRVTDFPSNPNRGFPGGRFIGDYFTIQAGKSDVYMVWADTRLGEYGGGFNQKVAFARKRAIANPQVFISPPSGAGGQNITVQGFNLQPGITAYIQVGGQVVQTQRTGPDGRFIAQLFVPVTGEGAQDVRIIDESGNVASTSYYTDFGFGSIKDGQQKIQTQLTTLGSGKGSTAGTMPPMAATWMMVAVAAIGGIGFGSVVAMALTGRRPRGSVEP